MIEVRRGEAWCGAYFNWNDEYIEDYQMRDRDLRAWCDCYYDNELLNQINYFNFQYKFTNEKEMKSLIDY